MKYALGSDEQRREMDAIRECWDKLQSLSSPARFRAIDWLQPWAKSEVPADKRLDHDF